MSWDIYVMDLPMVTSVAGIPDDWAGKPLGSREAVLATIREATPSVDFSDPTWGVIDGDGYSIEVNIGAKDPVENFALHVRGGGSDVVGVIAALLACGGWRAIDPQSETGIFAIDGAYASLESWERYRDHVVNRRRDS